MSHRNLTILLTAIAVSLLCYNRHGKDPHGRYISEAYVWIDDYALDQPAEQELVAGAVRGMVDVLQRRGDEHSRYIPPRDAQPFREEIRQEFGGIGVRIRMLGEPPILTVFGPPEPGTPAYFGGVKADDKIIAIDGEPTAGIQQRELLQRMRGIVGEPITLTVEREDVIEPITIALVREVIKVPSVIGDRRLSDGSWRYRLEQDDRVALIRITTVGNKTADELQALLPKLKQQGVQAFVLDVRDNAGGALDVAVESCDLFLPAGAPIVETRGRNGRVIESSKAEREGPFTELPIAVLVNQNSASAAEILAACLQDNDRAIVIGQQTFGKGTVQQLIPIESGDSLLKLTSASYWRPSGTNIHRMPDTPEDAPWGVRPDEGYKVELSPEEWLEFAKARSLRDVMPIDAPENQSGNETEIEIEDPLSIDSEASQPQADAQLNSAEPEQTEKPAEEPKEFSDAVLNRAVEYLQALLDGSA